MNVTIVRKAVYEKDKHIKLHLARQENLGMSSIQRHDSESGEIINVEAISLDEYLRKENINEVKIIKIDIEGAELPALKGMDNILSRLKPVLMVEVSPDVTKSSKERLRVFDLLYQKNYERFVIQNDGKLRHPKDQELNDHSNFVFIQNS